MLATIAIALDQRCPPAAHRRQPPRTALIGPASRRPPSDYFRKVKSHARAELGLTRPGHDHACRLSRVRDAGALFIVAERDTRRVAYRHIQALREKILMLREAPTRGTHLALLRWSAARKTGCNRSRQDPLPPGATEPLSPTGGA